MIMMTPANDIRIPHHIRPLIFSRCILASMTSVQSGAVASRTAALPAVVRFSPVMKATRST